MLVLDPMHWLFKWSHYSSSQPFSPPKHVSHLEWETRVTGCCFFFSLSHRISYIPHFYAGHCGGLLLQTRHTWAAEHCNLPPSSVWRDDLGAEKKPQHCTSAGDMPHFLTCDRPWHWLRSGKNDTWKVSGPIGALGTQDCGQVLASAEAFGAQTLHRWIHARQLVCWAFFTYLSRIA